MCLILVGVQARAGSRVLLLANRDEFHARAAARAAPWHEDARVLGGRDLVAGGSWLAVRHDGRFAAVTNVRCGQPRTAPRSRGELVRDFVEGEMRAADYLDAVRDRFDQYSPFNLIVGDAEQVLALDGVSRTIEPLSAGLHAISNGALDDHWPKMQTLRQHAAQCLRQSPDPSALLDLLRDTTTAPDAQLPDTGFGLERERLLSPIFIVGEHYGTRASTLLEIGEDGRVDLIERSFGPHGVHTATSAWRHAADDSAWCAMRIEDGAQGISAEAETRHC
ncbi:MAG: NRDE family protein [Xanthomonadales bacterium]|nr:NRDE family protein [Xanthomonadales bacterium]